MQPELHAATRLRERYGIAATWPDIRRLTHRCAHGEGLVEVQGDGSQLHAIVIDDRVVWLIFQPVTEEIVTALPPRPEAAGNGAMRDFEFMIRRKRRRR